ncbi:Uncharacterised protein [Enterobacter cancerogenus]|uniref:Uncharacterized protein n=1 Tax=Enterobacter cancerogenus TaxID=69218 RepID=A0A484Y9X8_9ENTR|nr:Uncharacterised protein [Enterobacter cancerogenus]
MGHSMRLMIVASLVCLTGMRDPFQPRQTPVLPGNCRNGAIRER